MTKRIDPLGICASANTKVEGRLDLLCTDICPIVGCGKKMKPILAADIPAFVCWEHRVVLPQPNNEEPVGTAVFSSK
jgi:hypothetical protein